MAMIPKGMFASTATCTTRDRKLEDAINARLPLGRVACYTINDGDSTRYGITYSYGIKSKTFERERFDMDIDAFLDGLHITGGYMQNTMIPRGWVYDQEEADANPMDDA